MKKGDFINISLSKPHKTSYKLKATILRPVKYELDYQGEWRESFKQFQVETWKGRFDFFAWERGTLHDHNQLNVDIQNHTVNF